MELVRRRNRISVILVAVLTALAVGVVMLCPAQAAAASKPGQVKNVKVSSKSYNSVKLTWSKTKGATGYQVYRATSKNGRYKKIKTTKSRSYTNSKLTTGKRYYYKVRAYKGKRYGKFSAKKSGIPKVGTPSLKASAGTTSIKLSWTKVAGASGYKLYRGNTCIKTTKATSYINSGLKQGTKYSYKVRAYRTVKKKNYYGNYSSTRSIATKVSNAAVSLSYGGKTLKLGAAFDEKQLGSADMVVNRGVRKVYIYDSKDCSNYLEVNVGTTGSWNGKILGWYTNQPQIGVVNGKSIKQGMSNSQIQTILGSTTKSATSHSGKKGYYVMDHAGTYQCASQYVEGTMFFAYRTAQKNLRAGEIRLRYVEKDHSADCIKEDFLIEHRINSLRTANGMGLLKHDDKVYKVAEHGSNGWLKQGHTSADHKTPDGLTPMQRARLYGIQDVGENIHGPLGYDQIAMNNGLASTAIIDWYNSDGHRGNICNDFYDFFANCTKKTQDGDYFTTTNFAYESDMWI